MRRWVLVVLVAAVSLAGLAAFAQESGALNIAFIFDASGSMMAGMEGRTRLAVAQDALADLSSNLPPNANTSLWVYGHRLPQDDPAASCQDIEQVIPLGPSDPARFQTAVRGIQAIGYTPITDSLQLAAQTLVDRPDERNTIVLISDGEETCGGSPCLMAQAIKAANIEMTVNTIGFAADAVTRQQLECIAQVTGGTYYDAQDAGQLTEALQSAVAQPGTVQIVDGAGQPVTDVAFQLLDAVTGQTVGDFVGSATVAGGNYRAVVPGEPVVDVTITVVPSETVDVTVDRPDLGTIRMVDEAGNPLGEQLFSAANVESGEGPSATGSVRLPPGLYNVTIYTTFPYQEQVTVSLNEVTDVVVHDDTGTLRMVDAAGNLLESQLFSLVNTATNQSASATGSMELPPGDYTVSIYTVFAYDTPVTITAGETTDVVVNTDSGTIQLVDENGAPLNDQLFSVANTETRQGTSAVGSLELPPGRYTVQVYTVLPFETEVDVTAGQTTEVEVSTAAGTVQLVDENGAPLPDQLFTFTNAETGDSSSAYGTQELPPGTYTLDIYTVFPQQVEVTVTAGETTEVEVSTAAGTVQLVDENGAPLPGQLFTFTNTVTGDSSSAMGSQELPPGTYTLDIYTIFPQQVEVTVTAGETTEVEVSTAAGTIQLVDESGAPLPGQLFTFTNTATGDSSSAMGSQELPPGTYELAVYTVFPQEVEATVTAGEVTPVEVDTRAGTVRMVDGRGNAQPAMLFSITRLEDNAATSASGEIEVPPGIYRLDVYTTKPFTVNVEVVEGEVTTVNIVSAATNRPAR